MCDGGNPPCSPRPSQTLTGVAQFPEGPSLGSWGLASPGAGAAHEWDGEISRCVSLEGLGLRNVP